MTPIAARSRHPNSRQSHLCVCCVCRIYVFTTHVIFEMDVFIYRQTYINIRHNIWSNICVTQQHINNVGHIGMSVYTRGTYIYVYIYVSHMPPCCWTFCFFLAGIVNGKHTTNLSRIHSTRYTESAWSQMLQSTTHIHHITQTGGGVLVLYMGWYHGVIYIAVY